IVGSAATAAVVRTENVESTIARMDGLLMSVSPIVNLYVRILERGWLLQSQCWHCRQKSSLVRADRKLPLQTKHSAEQYCQTTRSYFPGLSSRYKARMDSLRSPQPEFPYRHSRPMKGTSRHWAPVPGVFRHI